MILWIAFIIGIPALLIILTICFGGKYHQKVTKEYSEVYLPFYRSTAEERKKNDIENTQRAVELAKRVSTKKYKISRWIDQRDDDVGFICKIIAISCAVWITVFVLVIAISQLVAPSELAKLQTTREVLVYELEHNLYADNGDDVVGKKELYNQIREFNIELAENKACNESFWIGIVVPDIYDEIEPIQLP